MRLVTCPVIVPALCRHQTNTGLINITKYGDTWRDQGNVQKKGEMRLTSNFNLYFINRLSDAFHNYILQIESFWNIMYKSYR